MRTFGPRVWPLAAVLAAFGGWSTACSDGQPGRAPGASGSLVMGGPAAGLRDQISTLASRGVARYALPLAVDRTVDLAGEDPVFEEGRFAVSGRVDGWPQSRFLLAGDAEDVHGWITVRETGEAYLIRTVAG